MKRFRLVRQQLRQWQSVYPKLKIKIRKSHRGWRQQFSMIEGKLMPFESDPQASWNICLQRTCTQLNKQCPWKCPALAYYAIMSRKLRLDNELAWQLFRDYRACLPNTSDAAVRNFLAPKETP